jgi:protein-disulfide isomerase
MNSAMRIPQRINILAVLALIGVVTGGVLTQHFYEIRSGSAGFKSFCNVGQAMNCDLVAASPYAELFAGLPLSSFVVGWFVTLFIVALIARNPFWKREALRAAFFITGGGTLISLVYLGIMTSVLKTFCAFCLMIDLVSISSLAIVLSLKPEGFSIHQPDRAKLKTLGVVLLGSISISVAGFAFANAKKLDPSLLNEAVESVINTPPVAVSSDKEFPSIGNPDAPITIVEFSDFQCPHCRIGAQILNSVFMQYPGKVRIVLRNYPLDSNCNQKMQYGGAHAAACEAARASVCAHRQGKFKIVYEHLFEYQSSIAPGKVIAMANEAGVNEALLTECMNSPETNAAIARDLEDGERLGVQSTPTFFINGRKIEGAYPVPAWTKIIDRLLTQK